MASNETRYPARTSSSSRHVDPVPSQSSRLSTDHAYHSSSGRRQPHSYEAQYSQSPESMSSLHSPSRHAVLHPPSEEPSFTFVCLGVGGGPLENDCSCYMLKPAHRKWDEGSVVLEGGSWLGALTTVLQDAGSSSAFAGVEFPFDAPALRAGFIGSFAHSFLISHAHLDHILGLVLGSASLPGKRNVFGLKGTLDNLLDVFNGKIWPKLASYDENGGPAVYILKPLAPHTKAKIDEDLSVLPFALSHGLNPSVIPAPPTPTPVYASRLSLSSKRLSLPLNGYFSTPVSPSGYEQSGGIPTIGERPVFTSPFAPESSVLDQMSSMQVSINQEEDPSHRPTSQGFDPILEPSSPTSDVPLQLSKSHTGTNRVAHASSGPGASAKVSRSRRPKTAQGSEKALPLPPAVSHLGDQSSSSSRSSSIATGVNLSSRRMMAPSHMQIDHSHPALDSTAFFITNDRTGKDVLFFGDVEPDSISQSPRNERIWAHAGRRFAEGKLNAVFLECSFPASHPTEFLYGHLSVAHVYDELRVLARSVVAERKRSSARRNVAQSASGRTSGSTSSTSQSSSSDGAFRRMLASPLPTIPSLHTSERTITEAELHDSLRGLHVIIMHVKTALFPSYEATPRPSSSSTSSYKTAENAETVSKPAPGGGETQGKTETTDASAAARRAAEKTAKAMPYVGRKVDTRPMHTRILQELQEVEESARLGVQFVMAAQGMRIEC